MHQLATEWPELDRAYYIARASRALHGHPDQRVLVREYLAHIGVNGDGEGRPITDLKGWSRRQSVKRLRELITAFEVQRIAEREARLRRPDGPGIIGRDPRKDKVEKEDKRVA